MRGLTSYDRLEADETFEKVLRAELEAMKKRYKQQVEELKE